MPLRVAGAQLNLVVGDIPGNEVRIIEAIGQAGALEAEVLLLPELAINGYPPEDLVHRHDFVSDGLASLNRIADATNEMTVVVGVVDSVDPRPPDSGDSIGRSVANGAAVLRNGEVEGIYHKILLPNYGVFDEDRYFQIGSDPARLWDVGGVKAGVSVCEDIWSPEGPPSAQAEVGAQILLNINASPFHRGKAADREAMLAERARSAGAPVVYVNLVGAQDELVFDGASVVMSARGEVLHRSPQFLEDVFVVDVPLAHDEAFPHHVRGVGEAPTVVPLLEPIEEVYRALVTGLRDYVMKNGFDSVVIGLSGGIDSALTAAIAVDALGPGSVWGVAMPSQFSSDHSLADARLLSENLGIRFDVLPIDGIYSSFMETLVGVFEGTEFGIAEENLQARARGAILMALSNKFGPMVIATGNKSEMAVGYATLYGDMVGGFSVLKDVFKTLVYDLARWRNRSSGEIPQNSIDKAPSAELRPGQMDSDSLPPYDVMDPILERHIEMDQGIEEMVRDGLDRTLVSLVVSLVARSEYKRRQAAPGVKITTKAFGKDRRLPITNHYRPGSQ